MRSQLKEQSYERTPLFLQPQSDLLLELNHLPFVLPLLVHEGLLLLLQSLLDPLLVLDDPVEGVALLPHVLLALLPGVEETLHVEYLVGRPPAPAAQLDITPSVLCFSQV